MFRKNRFRRFDPPRRQENKRHLPACKAKQFRASRTQTLAQLKDLETNKDPNADSRRASGNFSRKSPHRELCNGGILNMDSPLRRIAITDAKKFDFSNFGLKIIAVEGIEILVSEAMSK